MNSYPQFGTLLNQMLAEKDRTPAWLARRLAINGSTVSRWLNDALRPGSPETVVRIADVLGVNGQREQLLVAAGYGFVAAAALEAADMPGVVDPAPQEPDWRRGYLPHPSTPLIGRSRDVTQLVNKLCEPTCRLLTLAGPGGVGKTRLSLEVALALRDRFADGVFFVSLAQVHAPELVLSTVAQTWNLQRQNDGELAATVRRYLHDKRALLVLDNFDHLMAAAPLVSELLAHCPHLHMIVTSRELLHVQGEHVYAVAPLTVLKPGQPRSLAEVAAASAVQLFVQRAQAIAPTFVLDESNANDVSDICAYLNGLPLAIELVVARLRVLTLHTLRQRLVESDRFPFELLQGGLRDAPQRHRTIEDTIAWSYDLLTTTEQRLLCLLAICAGGCTLDAAEQMAEISGQVQRGSVLDALASLVNKSLVQQVAQADGEARFSLLEMIREFAVKQLQASGLYDEAKHAHAATYTRFAEQAMTALSGPGYLVWIARLNAEHDNCRAALRWALAHQHVDIAVRMGSALWRYWQEQGYFREGREQLAAILGLGAALHGHAGRATILTGLGALCRVQGKNVEARAYLEEAISLTRERADLPGLAIALEEFSHGCYIELDIDRTQAFQAYTEALALFEKLDDKPGMIRLRHQFGMEKYHEVNFVEAQAYFEEALAMCEAQQYVAGMGLALHNLGRALFQQERFVEADQYFAEALNRAQAQGDQKLVADALYFRGRVAYYQADHARAKAHFEASQRLHRALGTESANVPFSLMYRADIALAEGDVATAQALLRAGLTSAYQARSAYAVPLILPHCALLAAVHGNHTRAVQIVAAARRLYIGNKLAIPTNDQKAFDAPLSIARPELAPAQFDRAWAAGERLTLDEAVAMGLAAIAGEGSPIPA